MVQVSYSGPSYVDGQMWNCPMCGGSRVSRATVHKISHPLLVLPESARAELTYYRCAECGVESQSPMPSKAAALDYYASGEYRADMKVRFLEVGSGAGALLEEVRNRYPGSTVQGVEVDRYYAAYAPSLGLPTKDVVPAFGPFDLVAIVHTLEHLAEPGDMLRQCLRRTELGGFLYCEVPLNSYAVEHPIAFTAESFVQALHINGWHVLEEFVNDKGPKRGLHAVAWARREA